MTTDKAYGHTHDGRPIDDALIAKLADEAERGYTVEQLANRPRGRGRPPLGPRAKKVGSVRLDAELRQQAAQRADADGISVSEVVRRALREYLRSA
jgi:predicted HicB family RNase H-like nuclease